MSVANVRRRSFADTKVVENTQSQMARRGEEKWVEKWVKVAVINRWSDKFKCFSPWQKIEKIEWPMKHVWGAPCLRRKMKTKWKLVWKLKQKKTKRKNKVGKGRGEEEKIAQSEPLRSHGALRGSGWSAAWECHRKRTEQWFVIVVSL